nr:hypothetical protein [Nonomuraea dietziae]
MASSSSAAVCMASGAHATSPTANEAPRTPGPYNAATTSPVSTGGRALTISAAPAVSQGRSPTTRPTR